MRELGDEPSLFSYSSIDPVPTVLPRALSLTPVGCDKSAGEGDGQDDDKAEVIAPLEGPGRFRQAAVSGSYSGVKLSKLNATPWTGKIEYSVLVKS